MGNPVQGISFTIAFGGAVQRQIIRERAVRYDDARGVRTGVTGDALQLLCGIEQLPLIRYGIVEFFELWNRLQSLGNTDGFAGDIGDQPGDFVHFSDGDSLCTPHIPNGSASAERSESDDAADFIGAIASGSVGNELVTPVIGIVEVNIRHGDAVGVEKTLKKEAVFERLDIGDLKGVGYH
ncbi:MAG: hypothetical protein BWY63_02763 [Chloroflexi bacterium ADurb.Bin360]|nr:MAG: hypothetical protein BWY63_02763 [Chloroflexi bacterium ADurb.Bin360]